MFFNYKKIGSYTYSEGDLGIRCNSSFYLDEIVPINCVIIILLGIVIPVILAL